MFIFNFEFYVEHLLVKSEENLEETFEETSITSPLIKTMTSADIEKHTSTILMQIRLTEYFADCEKKGVCPRKVFTDLLSPSGKVCCFFCF